MVVGSSGILRSVDDGSKDTFWMKNENARNKSRPARPRCSFQWQPQSVGLSRRVPPPVRVPRGQAAQRASPQLPCPLTQKRNTYSVMKKCLSEEWSEHETKRWAG